MGIFDSSKKKKPDEGSKADNPIFKKFQILQGMGYRRIILPSKGTSVPGVPYKTGDLIGGKYKVLLICGGPEKTGMGVVYVATSVDSGEIFALKTHQDWCLNSPSALKSFENEARMWVGFGKHPYVVWASWVERIEGRVYIAIEYIPPDGKGHNTLSQFLAEKDYPRSLQWAIQLCYGMEYAYSHGLRAHLDIKPDNIMITPSSDVKITDFGLARVYQEISVEEKTGPCGTPYWMPPEQFVSVKDAGPANDIYSFGVVLFQMVTGGELPFITHAQTKVELFQKMQKLHELEPVPRIDSDLYPIILRCMAKKPEGRYSSFGEIRLELETLDERQGGQRLKPPSKYTESANDYYNTGYSYATLGDDKRAIEFFDKALEQDSGNWKFWHEKAAVLARLGLMDEALRHYDRASQINPGGAAPLWNKAITYIEMKRYEDAIAPLRNFVEMAKGLKEFQENIKFAERAIARWNLEHIRDEIDHFLKDRGYSGFSAVAECIERAASENRVRKGKFETFLYTIHQGYWLIDEEVLLDQKETTKALTWLACAELGVPKDLCERLMVEMDSEDENEK